MALLLIGVVVLAVRALVIEPFRISSDSMAPTLQVGDRVVVEKLSPSEVERGEVIVFSGEGLFGTDGDYAKRVIGLPGDRVACCDDQGRVTVNGDPLAEPYLPPGEEPSAVGFDAIVPADRLWVMGDNRSISEDSRALLGKPGGGMLPVRDVVGRVVWRYWPADRWGTPVASGSSGPVSALIAGR